MFYTFMPQQYIVFLSALCSLEGIVAGEFSFPMGSRSGYPETLLFTAGTDYIPSVNQLIRICCYASRNRLPVVCTTFLDASLWRTSRLVASFMFMKTNQWIIQSNIQMVQNSLYAAVM